MSEDEELIEFMRAWEDPNPSIGVNPKYKILFPDFVIDADSNNDE